MKIKKIILIGMAFLGIASITACKVDSNIDSTGQTIDNNNDINNGNNDNNNNNTDVNNGNNNNNNTEVNNGNNGNNNTEVNNGNNENNNNNTDVNNVSNSKYITNYGALNPLYSSSSSTSNGDFINIETLGSSTYLLEDEEGGKLELGSGNVTLKGEVNVTKCQGSYEGAFILFDKANDATDYNIYIKKASESSYVKLTNKNLYIQSLTLSTYRADLFGLEKGDYNFKIVAVNEATESSLTATEGNLSIVQYDRSGYAHFNYTEGVGAYNDDGTLKENAIVLYVTDDNKNTVSLSYGGISVTGIGNILNSVGQACSDAGHENECKKVSNGKTYYGKANTNEGILKKLADNNIPLVVRFVGCVSDSGLYKSASFAAATPSKIDGLTAYDSVDYGGSEGDNGHMARMKSAKNVTLEGVGNNAILDGWGIHFICESSEPNLGKNFEVRNLAFINTPEDAIGMEGQQSGNLITAGVERCWVHHNSFYCPNISDPAESDKKEGDGSCDFKRGQYFTLSYNYFESCHKTNLVGSSDSSLQYNLSYHHNLWYNCGSRIPLLRQANIHFYNNFIYGDITDKTAELSYVSSVRANSYLFAEANYYEGCKNTYQIKTGGVVKAYGNSYVECFGELTGSGVTIASSREESVQSNSSYNGISYQNFDTNSTLFYYDSLENKSDCYLTNSYVAKLECIKFAGSNYRTVENNAKMTTSGIFNKTAPVKSIDLSSGSFVATMPSAKGNSEINGIYYTGITGFSTSSCKFKDQGITFKLTEAATVTVEMTGTQGLYSGQIVRSDGKVMLNGSGTAILNPGIYYICSTAMDKETTISSLKFSSYDSASYNEKLKEFAIKLYDEIPSEIVPTIECYNAIIKAINAYNLIEDKTDLIDPSDKLALCINLYKIYTEEEISKIGVVTKDSLELINNANRALNVLKAMDNTINPSNIEVLTEANNTFNSFAVSNCIDAINNIGDVDLSLDKKTLIEEALVAYDVLSDEQAEEVTNYNLLQEAVDEYNKLYNFALVNNTIVDTELDNPMSVNEAINLYNTLTEDEKDSLECKDKINQIIVKNVLNLIDLIPDEITSASGDIIANARKEYDLLSTENKDEITNYSKLISAEDLYQAILSSRHTIDFNGNSVTGNEFFTVSGSLKSGASAYTYEGEIYNYALKIDSKAKIIFTAQADNTSLVIVTGGSTNQIKVNGTSFAPTDGVIVTTVNKGEVIIEKGSGEGLIYLVIVG